LKRVITQLIVPIIVLAGKLMAGSPAGQQPVFIYLYARITDHVNVDVSEDRLRRLLPLIERYRKQHPDIHVSATILFSGAASQALADRNDQTHIVDYTRDFIQRGVIEPGYDGTDEPTYRHRPVNDFSKAISAEDRWLVRVNTAEKVLTEARDPLTGDAVPGRDGGLKKMQEVFGQALCITGVALAVPDASWGVMPEMGADTETVHRIRKMNAGAIMFGISDADPLHAPLFRIWEASFSKAMSPVPETSPELFWQDHVLRSSESSGPDLRLFRASDGPEAMQKAMGKLDRSRIRILHVELANQRNYLTPPFASFTQYPPLAYAYLHPDHPQLPAEARRPSADVDAAYAKESGTLDWLTREFFPANSGSHFVASKSLLEMAGADTGYSIPVERLRTALEDALRTWGSGPTPPKYLYADGHYLSLADMFQVMTGSLAEFHHTGKLPTTVRLLRVYGPTDITNTRGPGAGEVSVASVARVCAGLNDALHDESWSPLPKNAVPSHVTVDGIELNSAQFLRLMAEALVSGNAESKLKVKMTDMFWGRDATYYRSRSLRDESVAWTFKPAILQH